MFQIKQTCVPVSGKAKGQYYFSTQKETAGGWKRFVEVNQQKGFPKTAETGSVQCNYFVFTGNL